MPSIGKKLLRLADLALGDEGDNNPPAEVFPEVDPGVKGNESKLLEPGVLELGIFKLAVLGLVPSILDEGITNAGGCC